MQVPRDDLGQPLQHGVVHQVVREGRAAQDLLRLELGPGVGQVQRTAGQQRLGQLEREVDAGHRRHPRQLQGRGRQPRQLLPDQLRQRLRPR